MATLLCICEQDGSREQRVECHTYFLIILKFNYIDNVGHFHYFYLFMVYLATPSVVQPIASVTDELIGVC